jgi:hypothetical protein
VRSAGRWVCSEGGGGVEVCGEINTWLFEPGPLLEENLVGLEVGGVRTVQPPYIPAPVVAL